jgi:hypothetical protein
MDISYDFRRTLKPEARSAERLPARRNSALVDAMPSHESCEDAREEARRQQAIVVAVAAGYLAQVVAWPVEFIAFLDNDPRASVIEPEVTLDGCWNLNRGGGIDRRTVRSRTLRAGRIRRA